MFQICVAHLVSFDSLEVGNAPFFKLMLSSLRAGMLCLP